MADFVSNNWSWFIAVVSLVSILILFPFIYCNRGNRSSGTGEPETMGHVWDDDLEEYNNPLPGWWFNLFVITLVFGLVYLVLYPGLGSFQGVLNWSSTGQYNDEMEIASIEFDPLFEQYAEEDIKSLSANQEAMKTGERLFANYCAGCHGSDARGAVGFPNLRDSDWLYGGEPDQIEGSILNGRSGIMPPWATAVGENGAENIAHYLLKLGSRDFDENMAAEGEVKYSQLCVACHGVDGTGNQALGAPNLTDRIWLYGGSVPSIVESINNGRIGVMPAHKDFLGEDRVHLLAAYVYSLSQEYEQH